MKLKGYVAALLLLLGILPSAAIATRDSNSAISDSLYHCLQEATTPADSLVIMGNLFDVLPRDTGTEIGMEMFEVANRAGNSSAALSMLRNLANRYMRNDSMLVELYNLTLRYTDEKTTSHDPGTVKAKSDELMETRTFIRLTRNMHQARYANEEKRDELLHDLLRTNTLTPPSNLYDQIVLVHAMCTLLVQMGSNELLASYIDSLGKLIDQLPPSAISLRNAFNVHAAVIYADNGQYEKSMQADIKTLKGIDDLENMYRKSGRPFRNFDANRYIIYCRFLSNFPMLAPHEVEKYYNLAKELVDKDFTSAETYAQFPAPEIYYNLAYKNYGKALGYIKKALSNPYGDFHRRKLLKYEIECAEAVGDNQTLLEASREYNKLLENHIAERLDEKYRELQIVYDTYDMRNNYNRLQMEKQTSEAKLMRSIMIISSGAAVVLLILVIILFRMNRGKRTLVHTLDESNKALRTESENLEKSRKELLQARDMAQKANNLKSDFIKNMSYEVNAPLKAINEYSKLIVDCADASNRKYLERFTSLVELNSELLTTIVEDVLHISELDSASVPIHNRSTDLRSLCTAVLDGVRHRVNPGVALQFDTASPAISLFTDPQRVHQILLNLLTNAAKFTPSGSITLGYKVDNDRVIFCVTDTGIGIKADKKDVIFDRFVKLDKQTQGSGLGLTISRMIARMLGGDVELDTSYNRGARFIFTLPKK